MSILVHEISSSGIYFALENILHVVFRLSAISGLIAVHLEKSQQPELPYRQIRRSVYVSKLSTH